MRTSSSSTWTADSGSLACPQALRPPAAPPWPGLLRRPCPRPRELWGATAHWTCPPAVSAVSPLTPTPLVAGNIPRAPEQSYPRTLGLTPAVSRGPPSPKSSLDVWAHRPTDLGTEPWREMLLVRAASVCLETAPRAVLTLLSRGAAGPQVSAAGCKARGLFGGLDLTQKGLWGSRSPSGTPAPRVVCGQEPGFAGPPCWPCSGKPDPEGQGQLLGPKDPPARSRPAGS